jgi:signal transduction histidine kinase
LVVLWAWLIETALLSTTVYRFSLVWYAGRTYGILSSSFVLLVLLSESTMLYARLARSVIAQRHEREGRLMSMDVMSAAIAHEIKQPLGAMVANANAGLRWLSKTPPGLDQIRDAFNDIAAGGHRADEVIQSVRAIFSHTEHEVTRLDANELIRETIAILRGDLEVARISVQLELAANLPLISAHRGQLQQVVLNLVTNAADAMRIIMDRGRVLKVKSETNDAGEFALFVEDSGTGIDQKNMDRIFDAFFTTKSKGMGMGLAICRSIVESHGGTLSASPNAPHGSVFRVVLPRAR